MTVRVDFPMPAKRVTGSGPHTRRQRRIARVRQLEAEGIEVPDPGDRPRKARPACIDTYAYGEDRLDPDIFGPSLTVGENQLRQRASGGRNPTRGGNGRR